MSKRRVMLAFLATIASVWGFDAQAQNALQRIEMMNQIRREKFDIVLPKAMRENKIDMWITMTEKGHDDLLCQDLGKSNTPHIGYYIFTDRGGDRIERAALGLSMLEQTGAYDIFGPASDLKKFVSERAPKRIGINISERIKAANGLSHMGYLHLVKTLGEPYASRLVSAEKLISDFRSRRVVSEILAFANAAAITVEIMERALSNEVITPGVTMTQDVACWWAEQAQARGAVFSLLHLPRVSPRLGSAEPLALAPDSSTIIQRGDVLVIDWGINMMNLNPDIKRTAYVLQKGETEPPLWYQKAFEKALKLREIICKNIKVGRTGAETLEILYRKAEEAGYAGVKMEGFARTPEPTNIERLEVIIGCHSVGNLGHGVGPSIVFFHPFRQTFTIQPTNFFSIEYFTYIPIPELGGKKVRVALEDNAIVTENGIEWLHPPNNRILLIK